MPARPDALRLAWFQAPDRTTQAAQVRALVTLATGAPDRTERLRATTHLIELTHLAAHPSDRRRLVEALGQVRSASAVPALHAELHHPDPGVRESALVAIGETAYHFGGAMVARWMAARDLSLEPPGIVDAALVALARTGNAGLESEAARLWGAGLVSARALHLALADAASPAMLDLARAHVSTPEAAVAAALHLGSRQVPDLLDALRPLRRSTDLAHVHLAERLIDAPHQTAESDLLELVSREWPLAPLGRAARRLRVHPATALLAAARALQDELPPGSPDRPRFIEAVLLIGDPDLQACILDWLEETGEPRELARALGTASRPTAALRSTLDRAMVAADPWLATAALRCRSNVFADLTPDDLDRVARSGPEALATEAVRAVMNLHRDRKGADRRTTLMGRARRATETMLRNAIREGAPRTRSMATYAVGNMGMVGLQEELLRLGEDADTWVRQAAAASLHVLPATVPADTLLGWARREPSADVRFRLGLCLLEALEAGSPVDGEALGSWCREGLQDRADLAVLAVRLRGHAADDGAAAALEGAAGSPHLPEAAAALTALGVLASADTLPALESALGAPDPARRIRAAEALAAFAMPRAGTLLVETAMDDADEDVRRAALASLARRPAGEADMARLAPTGPDDPLLFELLQARAAAEAGGHGVEDVDAALASAIPGLEPARLDRRCPGALRALRSAQFLSSGVSLPAGLDAAPPALFWVKGLELWLDVELRGVQHALRGDAPRQVLDGARWRWSPLRQHTPGWPQGAREDGWDRLLGTLLVSLEKRHAAVLSLTCVAGMLVVAGPLADTLGLPPGLVRGADAELGALAADLVALAAERNRLTHRESGSAAEVDAVRARALRASARVVAVFG